MHKCPPIMTFSYLVILKTLNSIKILDKFCQIQYCYVLHTEKEPFQKRFLDLHTLATVASWPYRGVQMTVQDWRVQYTYTVQ